jgi:deazaflavin-dependent oxidoreductase (nitroreductase family)
MSVLGVLARVSSRSTCRLTHHGRTSGRAYEVTIWFLPDGQRIYLTTMNMQRNWPRNVQANPRVTLTIDGERLTGTARVVSDASEMGRVVDLLKRKYWIARPYLWIKKRPDGAFRIDLDRNVADAL